MNEYERKQEARRERLEARAERRMQEANDRLQSGRQRLQAIPFGQPIILGRGRATVRDINYREKACGAMERGWKMQEEAAKTQARADAVGTGGISSDDPDAVKKLEAQLAEREKAQEMMTTANKLVRKKDRDGLLAQGWPVENVDGWLNTPSWGGKYRAFEPFELSNNNANIKRIKDRIASLKAESGREYQEIERAGVKVVQNPDINRIQLVFPDKPSAEVRAILKGRGFRWAPSEGAWQRQLNNAGIFAAKCVLESLEAMS